MVCKSNGLFLIHVISDAAVISDPPRLTRQPTICFRSPETSKQSSIDEEIPASVLYENEEYVDMPNGGGNHNYKNIQKV